MTDPELTRRALVGGGLATGLGGVASAAIGRTARPPAPPPGGPLAADLDNLAPASHEIVGAREFSPIGNGGLTLGGFNLLANDTTDRRREFLFSFGANMGHATAGTPASLGVPADAMEAKVVLYVGGWAKDRANKAWAGNSLLHLDGSIADPKYYNVHEFDIDNHKRSFGSAPGAAGLGDAGVHGITVNGANPNGYTVTSGGCLISSSGAGRPLFERGWMTGPASVAQADFDSYSDAAAVLRASYGSHAVGIDLRGARFALAGMATPVGVPLSSATARGTLARQVVTDARGALRLGDPSGHAAIVAERDLLPAADNLARLGSPGARWASIWCATGTIQTSDGRLKTDLAAIDPARASAMVDAVEPRSYRWKEGGRRPVVERRTARVEAGTERRRIAMETRAGPIAIDADLPVHADREIEAVTGDEPVAGRRRHFGFVAGDVAAGFRRAGFEDFGGYVKDAETGIEAIRPDQLLAVLWAEVRTLRARVAALEAAGGA